ncbi:MAG TPA: hypothetical protein VHU19_18415 [Pyrinomonadaceae bacterium]|jgi:hypothetical protein|nr:hypothetical protein [Pyrinomonadaceae bacterium]
MDVWGEDIERAYETWVREREATGAARHERRCMHYAEGTPQEPYPGEIYLRALQRLRGSEAAHAARQVEPFFWSDAKAVRVWLCGDCSARLGLRRDEHN